MKQFSFVWEIIIIIILFRYHNNQLYLIDVSQSVEKNHPHALEFLMSDCTNVTEYFRKKDVGTLTVKKLFSFVTDMSVTEKNVEEILDRLQQEVFENPPTAEELLNDEIFKKTYKPQNLYEVSLAIFIQLTINLY